MSHVCGRVCPFNLKSLEPVGLALLVAGLAHAATQTVPCSGSGGGASGLVAAINTANSTPGPNTINLTPGCIYTLTSPYQADSPNGLPPITGIITVNAYGATIARSQAVGTPAFRIVAVLTGGNLTLNTVTVRGGSVNNGLIEGGFITGGGLSIDAGGKLTLNHSVVTENRADVFGGPECCGSSAGGGIYNLGIVTLNYSHVSKNVVSSGSESGSANGGGIASRGTLTLQCSTVTHNTASAGGLDNSSAGGGGIVSAGKLIMRHSLVSYNTVSAQAFGLDAEATAGGIEVAPNSTATLAYSTIRNNTATAPEGHTLALAGGLDVAGTATLYHIAIFGNAANSTGTAPQPNLNAVAAGGGLVIKENGKAKLVYTAVYSNSTHAPNGYALGGGVNNGGTATLAYSKVVNNTADGETLANSLGGGVHNARYEGLYFGIGTVNGSLTLINSQIAGNHPDQCDPTGSSPGCSH
jgi:hypothetical protein